MKAYLLVGRTDLGLFPPWYSYFSFKYVISFVVLSARVSELESRLQAVEEELEGVQDATEAELSRVTRQARADSERELEHKQTKIAALTRDNDKLQTEVV
jgi:hypothetical protein